MQNHVTHIVICKHATIRKNTYWYLTSRRVQRSVHPVKWHYTYHCHQHHADNYYTELYYRYQQPTGKKSEKFQLNCEQQKIAFLPIIDTCLPNNTLKLATEQTTLDFDLRQDKRKRADLLRTSRETGTDSLSSGRLQCVPEGKHKTRRTALNVFPIESQM